MKQVWTRGIAVSLSALLLASGLSGCSSGLVNNVNTGEINPNTEQTEFDIMGGISALSSGYENNEVLNQLQENVGIKINWETMSDSPGRAGEHSHHRRQYPTPSWAWLLQLRPGPVRG